MSIRICWQVNDGPVLGEYRPVGMLPIMVKVMYQITYLLFQFIKNFRR
jgi:hypothetical protein